MQADLNTAESDLGISIIALNEAGYGTPANYELTGEKGSLPVLQDVNEVDVWEAWEVTYRDVIILNECGEKMDVYNLTSSSLHTEENYNALREMILGVAQRD
jgi:hypothetical protein